MQGTSKRRSAQRATCNAPRGQLRRSSKQGGGIARDEYAHRRVCARTSTHVRTRTHAHTRGRTCARSAAGPEPIRCRPMEMTTLSVLSEPVALRRPWCTVSSFAAQRAPHRVRRGRGNVGAHGPRAPTWAWKPHGAGMRPPALTTAVSSSAVNRGWGRHWRGGVRCIRESCMFVACRAVPSAALYLVCGVRVLAAALRS